MGVDNLLGNTNPEDIFVQVCKHSQDMCINDPVRFVQERHI